MELIVASVGGFFAALVWQVLMELFGLQTPGARMMAHVRHRRAVRHQAEAAFLGGL